MFIVPLLQLKSPLHPPQYNSPLYPAIKAYLYGVITNTSSFSQDQF